MGPQQCHPPLPQLTPPPPPLQSPRQCHPPPPQPLPPPPLPQTPQRCHPPPPLLPARLPAWLQSAWLPQLPSHPKRNKCSSWVSGPIARGGAIKGNAGLPVSAWLGEASAFLRIV